MNMDETSILLPPAGFANNDLINAGDLQIDQVDSELKRLLLDEKDRNEQLKKYYETLKADYSRSQNEVLDLQTQLKTLIEDNKLMQEKYRAMFEKMQQELRKKQLYIEELKDKELDDVKLERLKEELSQQIEIPYKDIVRQLELELERLQQDCNKLRYEATFLKSTNEHEKNEFQSLAEQIKLKYDVELNAIRKDRDQIRQKLQENNYSDANKLKEILKENSQFKVKIKALLEENEELRTKLEHIESHQSALLRNNSKAVADYTTKISILESEKESLKHQNDNYYKETLNLNETIANNVRKIHDLERENNTIKTHIDEVQFNCKKEVANLRIEIAKEKGEHNRTKENLLNEIAEIKTKYEIAEGNVQAQKRQLEDKEREIAKSVNSANEENWSKIKDLTNEKLDLESKLQILQKDLEYKISLLQADKDKFEEKYRGLEKQRDEAFRENTRLKLLVNDSDNVRVELEKEQEKNRDLYKKCHKLETDLAANNGLEQELTEINLKLKNELSFYTQEMQKSKEHIKRMKDEYENRLGDMKSQYVSEKSEYQLRCDELNSKLTKQNLKMNEVMKFHEKRKKQYQSYLKKIKTKTELLNAKLRELKLKEQAFKDYVPLEVHNKVKKQLNDILRRHQDFRSLLTTTQTTTNPAIIESSMIDKNDKTTNLIFQIDSNAMKETRFEFDEITNRIDALTQKQNDQLKDIVSSSIKSKHQSNPKTRIKSRSPSISRSPSPTTRTRSPSLLSEKTRSMKLNSEKEKGFKSSDSSDDDSISRKKINDISSEIVTKSKSKSEKKTKSHSKRSNDSYSDEFDTSKSLSK